MRTRIWGCLVVALVTGCMADAEDAAVSSCDPLATTTGDVALATVIGAGKGADGTVYVIDSDDDGELRAFVSQADELHRQRVGGTGEGTAADGSFVTVSLNELDPPLTIQVTTETGGSTRMGVVTGSLMRTFTIGEDGEELSLMTDSDAKALPVHNYPAEILVEYAATLDDGRRLVVLRPRDFSDTMEFRVFLGPKNHLDERHVSNVTRARDGGSTTIDFEVDGKPSRAAFPVELTGDTFAPGAPSLSVGDEDVALSLTTPPAGAAYYCVN